MNDETKGIAEEAVRIYFNCPKLSIKEAIEKAKEVMNSDKYKN